MVASFPESLARGLRALAALSQPQYEVFLSYLREIPAEIKHDVIFSGSSRKIPEAGESSELLKSAAFSLILSRVRGHLPVAEFVGELIDAVSASPGFEDSKIQETLSARASEILKIGSLDLVARANDVLTMHACAYLNARILTDIRPVFGDDVDKIPIGAVLVHMLSINYENADRRDSFVVALDEKDIEEMISVLERAKRKSKTLKDTINMTGVPYIEVI